MSHGQFRFTRLKVAGRRSTYMIQRTKRGRAQETILLYKNVRELVAKTGRSSE